MALRVMTSWPVAEPAEWPAWKTIPDGRFGIAHGGLAMSPILLWPFDRLVRTR